MKSKLLTAIAVVVVVSVASAQELQLDSFDAAHADTNHYMWFDLTGAHYGFSDNAHTDTGYINLTYPTADKVEGAAAMQMEWSVHNTEGWGGYTKLEHWHPDSNAVYNWAGFDSIAFSYNNIDAQDSVGRVHFRLNLHEVSHSTGGNKTYDTQLTEYYYSFHYVLDNDPGWHTIKMPLVNNYSWDGNGFNLTGWAGIGGNSYLDKDKIKGYSFEFSISGSGNHDFTNGVMLIDDLKLFSPAEYSLIFFNGRVIPGAMETFTWNGLSLAVEEGTGSDGESSSLKVTPVAGTWNGGGWNIPPSWMNYLWPRDTLHFEAKAEEGFGTVRLQWEAGPGKVGIEFTPTDDGAWHDYHLALADFDTYYDGTSGFDTAAVAVLHWVFSDANPGKAMWLDNMWTGHPVIDIVDPEPPTAVEGITNEYYNLVIWQDTDGEVGEFYNVYASPEPITDVSSPEVDVIGVNIPEGTQTMTHWLNYPLEDKVVVYYYAVVCADASGNESTIAPSTAVYNTAKGVATISMTPPANFVADGDVTEWEDAGIMPFILSGGSSHTWPDDADFTDADLTANIYIAVDTDYLYIAADVIDDVYSYATGGEGWWTDDALELFIGLYDGRGAKHSTFETGAQPDYSFPIFSDGIQHGRRNQIDFLLTPDSADYSFDPLGVADYVVETRIKLDSIAVDPAETKFVPQRGMRIPIDIVVHDADADNVRDGIVTLSVLNDDNSHQSPLNWTYTWVGDTANYVTLNLEEPAAPIAKGYSLKQNYPNPFNPVTKIEYSIGQSGPVRVMVYNLLGQEVITLVDEFKAAGSYHVDLNANQMASGIYFYRLETPTFSKTRKMVLLK